MPDRGQAIAPVPASRRRGPCGGDVAITCRIAARLLTLTARHGGGDRVAERLPGDRWAAINCRISARRRRCRPGMSAAIVWLTGCLERVGGDGGPCEFAARGDSTSTARVANGRHRAHYPWRPLAQIERFFAISLRRMNGQN